MLYLCIALAATFVGALSGVGGGVIIKPILDIVSPLDAKSISLLSSFTVLAMAITSITRHLLQKTKIEKKLTMQLAIGAVLGGTIGEQLLEFSRSRVNDSLFTSLQNFGLMLLLILVLIYMNKGQERWNFYITHPFLIIFSGCILGILSTFLGIGGGPINVVALTLLCSLDTKQAAVNSLVLIIFSQFSKILNITLTTGFASYNLSALWLMIPAGILGGYLGAHYYRKLTSKGIKHIFNLVLLFIIAINIYNIFL